MNEWAAHRRLVIFLIAGAVVVAFVAIMLVAALYRSPSCVDNKKNQDEVGVDCGGSCSYLCTSQVAAPTVLFTGLLRNATGRTDLVASIENKNTNAAARSVLFNVKLYKGDKDQTLVREMRGTLDLPPRATVPAFIPAGASGGDAPLLALF